MHDIGMVDVTLTGATGVTFTWKDPGTIDASSPTQVELEWAPTEIGHNRKTAGGTPAAYTIAATALGGTITGTAGDTSTIRITGKVYANGRQPR